MIKSFLKVMLYIIISFYLLVYFLPKTQLYYFGLEKLKYHKIEIINENIKEKPFGITLSNPKILYSGIETLYFKNFDLDLFIYDNKLLINNITTIGAFNKFIPKKIDNIELRYSLFDPLKINIDLDIKECVGSGYIDLVTKKVYIRFYPSKQFKNKYKMMFNKMKKINNKEYLYEYSL